MLTTIVLLTLGQWSYAGFSQDPPRAAAPAPAPAPRPTPAPAPAPEPSPEPPAPPRLGTLRSLCCCLPRGQCHAPECEADRECPCGKHDDAPIRPTAQAPPPKRCACPGDLGCGSPECRGVDVCPCNRLNSQGTAYVYNCYVCHMGGRMDPHAGRAATTPAPMTPWGPIPPREIVAEVPLQVRLDEARLVAARQAAPPSPAYPTGWVDPVRPSPQAPPIGPALGPTILSTSTITTAPAPVFYAPLAPLPAYAPASSYRYTERYRAGGFGFGRVFGGRVCGPGGCF